MSRSQRGRNARRKGRDYQAEVARQLAARLVRPFRSTQGSEVRDGSRGDVCEDPVRLTADSRPLRPLPLLIECKTGKRVNVKAALAQATEAAERHPGRERPWPVVFAHYETPNFEPALDTVTMHRKDWVEMLTYLVAGGYWGDMG